jgi:hypothetical protein
VRRQSFAICALLTSLPTFVKRPFGNGFTVSAGKSAQLGTQQNAGYQALVTNLVSKETMVS